MGSKKVAAAATKKVAATKARTTKPTAKTVSFDDAGMEAAAHGQLQADADVIGGGEVVNVSEQRRKRLHDAWVHEQISQGWACGAVFDPAQRTDPRLVHYDQLSTEQLVELQASCWGS